MRLGWDVVQLGSECGARHEVSVGSGTDMENSFRTSAPGPLGFKPLTDYNLLLPAHGP